MLYEKLSKFNNQNIIVYIFYMGEQLRAQDDSITRVGRETK